MKFFSKLKNFKSPLNFWKYKNEWRDIAKPKLVDEAEAMKKADSLLKENKFLESILLLNNVKRTKFGLQKEIEEKVMFVSKFIKDDLILRRYAVFKKYLSLGEDRFEIKRSFFYSLLIIGVFFYICFGSPLELSN